MGTLSTVLQPEHDHYGQCRGVAPVAAVENDHKTNHRACNHTRRMHCRQHHVAIDGVMDSAACNCVNQRHVSALCADELGRGVCVAYFLPRLGLATLDGARLANTHVACAFPAYPHASGHFGACSSVLARDWIPSLLPLPPDHGWRLWYLFHRTDE